MFNERGISNFDEIDRWAFHNVVAWHNVNINAIRSGLTELEKLRLIATHLVLDNAHLEKRVIDLEANGRIAVVTETKKPACKAG